MLICCFIFVCNAHLNIFIWNLRDINVYNFNFLVMLIPHVIWLVVTEPRIINARGGGGVRPQRLLQCMKF